MEYIITIMKKLLSILLFLTFVIGQSIQINEVMSSNGFTLYDEDGDTPDWIELYNSSGSNLDLSGYGLTDDAGDLDKWTFPDLLIEPEEFLVVFASEKNRTDIISQWDAVIDWGDQWKYFVGNSNPTVHWKELSFDDSNWSNGQSGFGYGDSDDNTIIPQTISVFVRKSIYIEDPSIVEKAVFNLDYDDGYVAYLNGQEISRRNLGYPGSNVYYNQSASELHEAEIYSGGFPESIWLDINEVPLIAGENVLAIEVHNYNIYSSDLSCIPFLTFGYNTIQTNVREPNPSINLPTFYLHTNFKINSNGENLILSTPLGETIDSVYTGIIHRDISLGRLLEGDTWGIFSEPTPNSSNNTPPYIGTLLPPGFSQPSGFYPNGQTIYLSLTSEIPNAQIYFTIDGSEPTTSSLLYVYPIPINSNRVVRAKVFLSGWYESKTQSKTYIFDESHPETVPVSVEVCAWFNAVKGIVMDWTKSKDLGLITNKDRMEYISKLGKIFEEYRNTVYNKGFSGTEDISLNQISEFIFAINNDLETTISSSKNANGLYHAYNTIQIDLKKQSMDVQHLDLMLEGQVAALSSGLLKTDDAIEVLDTLSVSELYRESMRSFMLYPIKKVTPYLEKNIIQPHSIAKSKLLSTMLQNKDFTLIEQDADDQFRFKPQFRNSFDLQAALHQILDKKDYKDLIDQENDLVLEIFEEVFDHRNFTGRSGTMFSYEGIGSIYWHMISKLLLAVQENYFKAVRTNVSSEKVKKLGQLYYDIRGGLSAAKTPEEYGAFPYDPYSHTPAHSGAQQPGMTGQVKEEILTRFGELGCTVAHGCIRFEPYLLKRSEFLTTKQVFKYYDVFHQKRKLTILENQLAYTFCQVPVIYTLSDKHNHILLELSDGSKVELDGNVLDEKQSNLIFNRDGKTAQIKVFMNNNILFNR